jgi:uncharacterized protein YbjT (DUF2867 family)
MDLARPILVTGASGRTGRAAIAAIARRGGKVRAFIRRAEVADELKALGAAETVLGDLMDRDALARAVGGAGQILHICPPMHPQEDVLAATMIDLAAHANVDRLVLYSVLHPLLSDVPHHARKLAAEQRLVDSGLPYTILQPGRYMQHLVPIWKSVLATGVHAMPFSASAKFSVVDLADLAEAAALVLTKDGHESATYQLAGPQPLSQQDMAAVLTDLLGRPIRAEAKPLDEMLRDARAAGMPAERIETMRLMNVHYDSHGLVGNPNVLAWLLGRPPGTFADFVRRDLLNG